MIILQIIGLILIAITYWIHKRTYSVEYKYNWSNGGTKEYSYSKIKSPLWVWLLVIIVNIIPFITIAAFIIGGFAYIVYCSENDIAFIPDLESKSYKVWSKIKTILTKDV